MLAFLFLIFCYFIFLFFLYYLAKDDFVIIRKNIQLEQVFSVAIMTGLFSLFSARLSFAIFFMHLNFFNPLVFFAIPYFPGLSMIGGVAGGVIFLYLYSLYKKIQIGRLFDLFIMSFIFVFPIGLILNFFVISTYEYTLNAVMLISSLIMLILFGKIIFPFSSKGEIRDGSLGLIFILALSFLRFTANLFLDFKNFSFLSPVNIFILIVFFTSLIVFINLEVVNKYLPPK